MEHQTGEGQEVEPQQHSGQLIEVARARRRQRAVQAKLRSMNQRLGERMKPRLASGCLTTTSWMPWVTADAAGSSEPPRLARDYMMEVLARTHTDLTAREISRRMQHLGYEPKGEHPEGYVAKLLRENPHLFERHSSWRWGFRQG